MKSLLQRLCVAAFGFVCAQPLVAQPSVSLTAAHEYKFPISEEEYQKNEIVKPIRSRLHIWCYLKNIGTEPVKVSTAYGGGGLSLGGKTNVAELTLVPNEGPLGIKVVPSESELKIVILKPGESALIDWEHVGLPIDLKLDQLTVKLRTDGSIADRFGIWRGPLSTESKSIRTGL